MKWNKGKPEESGEYIVIMETNAGRQAEILNYGITDAYPHMDWYAAGEEGPVIFDNVIAWAKVPEYEEG